MIRPSPRRREEIWALTRSQSRAARARRGSPRACRPAGRRPPLAAHDDRAGPRATAPSPRRPAPLAPPCGRAPPFPPPPDLEERARAHARRLTHVDLVALEVAAPRQPARAHPPRDLLGFHHAPDLQQTDA